jgi:hypothetical protein
LLEIKTWGSKWKKKIDKTNMVTGEFENWPKKILDCSNKLGTFWRRICKTTTRQCLHMPWISSKNGKF